MARRCYERALGRARRFAFAEAYRMLRNRIGIFVNLPLPTLDRLALQARLNEIGRNLPHTA
jgi:arsenate reductase